jgi:hypothetical protein
MAEKLVVYALPGSEYVASLLTGLHSRGIKHAVKLVDMERKKRKLPSGGFKVPEITYENPAKGACVRTDVVRFAQLNPLTPCSGARCLMRCGCRRLVLIMCRPVTDTRGLGIPQPRI